MNATIETLSAKDVEIGRLAERLSIVEWLESEAKSHRKDQLFTAAQVREQVAVQIAGGEHLETDQ